jgi:hypothetical protein
VAGPAGPAVLIGAESAGPDLHAFLIVLAAGLLLCALAALLNALRILARSCAAASGPPAETGRPPGGPILAAGWGAGCAALGLVGAAVATAAAGSVVAPWILAPLGLAAVAGALAQERRVVTGMLLAVAATLGGIAAVALALQLQTRGLEGLLTLARGFVSSGPTPEYGGPDTHPGSPWWTQQAMVFAVLAVPTACALVLSLASLFLRVPLAVGLVRGFRGAALPVACLLLLVYGGLVLTTAHHEARLNYALDRTQQHEGRYLAEIAGEEWPGPVR